MRSSVIAGVRCLANTCRISLGSVPTFASVPAVVAQLFVEPLLNAVFYLLLASAASGGETPERLTAAALAATVGAASSKALEVSTNLFMVDRYEGTLPHLFSASSGTAALFAARTLCSTVLGMGTSIFTVCVLAMAGALPALGLGDVPLLAAVLFLCCLASSVLGLVTYTVSLTSTDELLVMNLCMFILPIACGSVAAVSSYPQPVVALCSLIPISDLTEAGRLVALGGQAEAVFHASRAFALVLVWLAAAAAIWRVGTRRQRRTGRFDMLGI